MVALTKFKVAVLCTLIGGFNIYYSEYYKSGPILVQFTSKHR